MHTWQDVLAAGDLRGEHNLRGMRSHAIQSQYSASARILGFARAVRDFVDPGEDESLFWRRIFNIHTAEGIGLDIWGRILQIGRNIGEGDAAVTLEDELYRLLLLYKAMANISPGDPASLNGLLQALVDTGVGDMPRVCYVLEVGPMVIRWVFEDFLTPEQRAVFLAAGTLARPGGVGWELYAVNPDSVFGFRGQEMHDFNQRPFAPDDALTTGV